MSYTSRRRFLEQMGAATLAGVGAGRAHALYGRSWPRRIAAIVTQYTHNSHADVLVSRLLQGFDLNNRPPYPRLQLAALYTDQIPAGDISRALAREHGFPIYPRIADALTLDGSDLAVDGVLLIGEHGDYPLSPGGQILYPRRRFFEETAAVFAHSGRSVPVFLDKHLAWNWEDAHWIAHTARVQKIPLMAGSSVPGTWRQPAREVRGGARLEEAVSLSFGPLEAYGYHALEAMQAMAERRRGGETGVRAVQYGEGEAVWRAGEQGRFDREIFETAATARLQKGRFLGSLRQAMQPAAFFIEYRDGFKATLLHDMGAANSEWVTAVRVAGQAAPWAVAHVTQEARPFGHFTFLLQGIERMMISGKPSWPVERTLLVTGILAAAFESRAQGGARIETPHLAIRYAPSAPWRQPPPQPPDRPIA
jgi:hypothetical protein